MATVYIQKEEVDHINLINDTGADLSQYELTVIGGLVVIADEAIANGARGSFHCEENLLIQIDDFVSGEDTFGTADAAVYWKPTTGEFSDTSTSTYYKVGIVHTVKNSNSIVWVTLNRETELVGTMASDISALQTAVSTTIPAAYAAADDAQLVLAGRPFIKTATLTAAAAATPVDILTELQVGTGTVHITGIVLNVNGGTAWADATATIVTIQDTAGTPVVGITAAKAQLTGNAVLGFFSTGITLGDAIIDGTGFTAEKGLQIAGDANFGAGSDIIVTVSGFVIG
jgi:hypothetical protein